MPTDRSPAPPASEIAATGPPRTTTVDAAGSLQSSPADAAASEAEEGFVAVIADLQRIRRRWNQCRWANARSTTHRRLPGPEPCSVPHRAVHGVTPRFQTRRRERSHPGAVVLVSTSASWTARRWKGDRTQAPRTRADHSPTPLAHHQGRPRGIAVPPPAAAPERSPCCLSGCSRRSEEHATPSGASLYGQRPVTERSLSAPERPRHTSGIRGRTHV
jgi:hypothetical protein